MSYRVNAIEKELARQQMMQQTREIHAAQAAARQRKGADHEAFEEARKAGRPGDLFASGFSSPEQEPTTAKVDPDASTRDKFAAGFGANGGKEEPTILEKLMAYGERQAAQNTPMPPEQAPAAVVEPSPQARRAEATDASQGQQQGTEQLPLPVTTTALFSQLEQQVDNLTAEPQLPPDLQLRKAFRNLPGEARDAITAQVEAQDFGVPGYLGRYQPDYSSVLIGDALARRFADLRRLQPDVTPDDLLQQMIAAAQA